MKKINLLLLIVFLSSLFVLNNQVQAWTIPTFSIQSIVDGEEVTILTANFPAGYEFVARMGLFGTKGVGGIEVGTVNSGSGGALTFTFPIPDELASESQIAIRLDSTVGGFYAYNWFYNATSETPSESLPTSGSPYILTGAVIKGTQVAIKGKHFPANEDLYILMGESGASGFSGVLADTVNSSSDGEFYITVAIPETLKNEDEIAVRVESQDSDLVLYTSFENMTGSGSVFDAAGGEQEATPIVPQYYTGIPTIGIVSVVEDETITLKTYNFPANRDFNVLMGKIGTRGVEGILVETINSKEGGSFTDTFDIPEELKGDAQIAIRLQTADGYFYAYNWFYNAPSQASTTQTPGTSTAGYAGIPTFSIVSVAAGDKVTIQTNNFPAGYQFKVTMGEMGTKGVDGIAVTEISSGSGGALTETFEIPAVLASESPIAIRLESTVGGFYAYNWFYNSTSTP